ncbi:MAG: replication initiation protein [Chloroflexota bacterium]
MSDAPSVIKHSAAIHMANTLTVTERKIYNALLYHARPTLARGVDHLIETAALEEAVGFTSKNRHYLVSVTESLREKTVRYNIFGKDKVHREIWRMNSGLLAEVGFTSNNSACRYSFPNTLIDLMRNPSLYARINLDIQSRIRGHHTLPLYEFYLDMLGGVRAETQFDFSIEDLKDLLDLGDSYPEFKVLNRDIVQKAHREINEKTDLRVDVVTLMRTGRKVTGLRLHIVRPAMQSTVHHDEPKVDTILDHDLEAALLDVFRKKETVAKILREYKNRDYILANLDYARQMHARGLVKNLPAYVMNALKEDYRQATAKKESEVLDKHKTHNSPQKKTDEIENIEKAFIAHRMANGKDRYSKLSPEEQLELQQDFEKTPEYHAVKSLMGRRLKIDSPIFTGSFFDFVANRLCLEAEFIDIGAYRRIHSTELS